MNQPNKKPAPAQQPTAKLAATGVANKVAKSTFAAVESTRSSAENVVRIGSSAMKEFLSSSADEAQKAQEKAFSISRESAENFAKSADAATKFLYEAVAMSRDNIEACIECGNTAASFAKDVSSEAFDYANQAFSSQIETAREAFACRTLNDALELQSRLVQQTLEGFFNQSAKLSDMVFEYTNETLEPLNERVAQASDQINRALAA